MNALNQRMPYYFLIRIDNTTPIKRDLCWILSIDLIIVMAYRMRGMLSVFPLPQAFLWPWCPVERRLSSLTFGSLLRGSSAQSRSANMPLCPESPQALICLIGLQHIKSVTQAIYRHSTLRIILNLLKIITREVLLSFNLISNA